MEMRKCEVCGEEYSATYRSCPFCEEQEAILRGIERLCSAAADIVVVSNEIFSDGTPYDPSTQAYIARLAHLNAALAQRADTVVEVVCGIPIVQKGREWLCT